MEVKQKHIVLAALGVMTVAVIAYAKKIEPPATIDKVAGAWIGFNSDDVYYYRLILNTNGTGMCANTFVRNPAELYRVTKWTLEDYAIDITLEPVDSDAEPIWMKGTTTGGHLNLEIGGKNNEWTRKLKLYRETEVLANYERVKARMEKAGQPPAGDAQKPAQSALMKDLPIFKCQACGFEYLKCYSCDVPPKSHQEVNHIPKHEGCNGMGKIVYK
jgi:hypothetical protein